MPFRSRGRAVAPAAFLAGAQQFWDPALGGTVEIRHNLNGGDLKAGRAGMRDHEYGLKSMTGIACGLAGAAAIVLIGGALWLAPRPANALPKYAAETGLACGRCHVNPAGGGPRTAFGKAFAANGHKVPKK
jgi:hypothetical protein